MARNAPTYSTKHEQHTHAATRRHSWLWRTRTERSAPLAEAVQKLADGTTRDSCTRTEREAAVADAGVFSRELYARLTNEVPALDQAQGANWEPSLQRAMDDAVGKLAPQLGGDVDFAAVATKGLLERAAEVLPGLMDKLEQEQQQDADGEPGDGPTASDMLAAAMRRQADAVGQEVRDVKTALAGLAPGLEQAPSRKDEGDTRRMELIGKIKDDPELRRVLRLAGRLRRIHAQVRKTRTTDGCTELVSIEQGRDLDRVLADHLALINDQDFGDWALAELIEGKAPQYAMAGREPLGRGPITVLRDISGSMRADGGLPHSWAAAVCIVAVQVAHKERRQVTVANYTGGVGAVRRLDVNGKAHDISPVTGKPLARLGGIAELVMEIATDEAWGGTQLSEPLTWAMDHGGLEDERADLVMVTDGRADQVDPAVLARLQACKEDGLKVAAMTINRGRMYRALAQVCDSVVDLDRGDTARQAAKGITL